MRRSFKPLQVIWILCGIVSAQTSSLGVCSTEKSSVFYIWHATSPTRSQLTPALDSFKALFGGGNNWNSVGDFTDGYRTVSWDKKDFPSVIPGDYFVTTDPRGLELVPVSSQQEFFVSNDPSTSDNLFDSVNPKAARSFAALSPHRLFSYTRDATLKVKFHEAGSPLSSPPAGVKGFGAVFVDVDFPESTKVIWKGQDGCVLGEDFVRPLSKGLSFIGGYTSAPNIFSVEVLVPTTIDQIYADESDADSWCGTCKYLFRDYCYWCPTTSLSAQDYVVLDDFIYGEPRSESASPLETAAGQNRNPPPTPPSPTPAPYSQPFSSLLPTSSLMEYATLSPTTSPTWCPSDFPSLSPTSIPTEYTTLSPTTSPTGYPVPSPTKSPKKTKSPVATPTEYPTRELTKYPVPSSTDLLAGGQERYYQPYPTMPIGLVYPQPVPVPQPVPYYLPLPSPAPTPLPTFYPTLNPRVNCVTEVQLSCRFEDGTPCGEVKPHYTNCFQRVIFQGKITNVGSVDMDLTSVDFTFNGQTQSFLDQIDPSSVDAGQHVFVYAQDTADVCKTQAVTATLSIEAIPPYGSGCSDVVYLNFNTKYEPPPTYAPIPVPQPYPQPVPQPIPQPYPQPVPQPYPVPQPVPQPYPVPQPVPQPYPAPTKYPVPAPTKYPVPAPTKYPVPAPTNQPYPAPTKYPVPAPTNQPYPAPTKYPVPAPTKYPVPAPTKYPVPAPTKYPVPAPTNQPYPAPTKYPVPAPTKYPVPAPTKYPVPVPTNQPYPAPTKYPVPAPTNQPYPAPTKYPVPAPTNQPYPAPTESLVPAPTDSLVPAPTERYPSMDATPCISVIDEASQNTMNFFELKWIEFRFRFPLRPFCLLQPEPNLPPDLRIPAMFINDPLTRFSTVSRDQGDLSQSSDWFEICGLGSATTDKVAYFIDNSGSLSSAQVGGSFDLFQTSAAAAGMTVVAGNSNNDEDWVSPFLQDFL